MQAEAGAPLIASVDPAGTDRPGVTRPGHRVRSPRLTLVVLLLGAAVWGVDRATKAWALAELVPGQPREVLGSFLRFTLLFNPGAAFSLGTGITPVFTLVQAAVVIAVVVLSVRVGSWLWALGLGLVLGGAAGNLADRLTRPPGLGRGEVVDFLQLPNWPVFNVADSAICVAAALIALAAFRGVDLDGGRAGGSRPADAASRRAETGEAAAADGADPTETTDTTDGADGADGAGRSGVRHG